MSSAGQKQKRITIEQPIHSPDGQGGQVTIWMPRCIVWAHERPLSGREALQAAQVTAVLGSVWEMWYRTDISVQDRIVYGSRTLAIEALIDPTDTREELYAMCSEIQA
jgi:SPP1 family predicted phage head-tail adaptor